MSRAVHSVLAHCQSKLGSWVGSSVVHLGDHNVPNALMFIDKYTQVPRILGPLVLCIEAIDDLAKDAGLGAYIQATFGGAERLKKTICTDFFRHAFDGSGADNFFDAGSCRFVPAAAQVARPLMSFSLLPARRPVRSCSRSRSLALP